MAQTPICQIQGNGISSPFDGQTVTTTGVVTALYSGTGTLQGYFIEDPNCDANAATSNGLFVYDPNTTGISVGSRVQVTGVVQEFQSLTELYAVSNLQVIGSGSVTPTNLSLPLASLSDWERYEGMLLRFPGTLTVTDNENWAQYGELELAPERLVQPTQVADPNDVAPDGNTVNGTSNVTAITTLASLNQRSSILLDDGRTSSWPSPPPLQGPQGTLRCGSTINNLTGVLHFMYGAYRIEPVGAVPITHAVRPNAPDVGGDLRIVSMNVLNYFTTLSGDGAANAGELQRQRTKLVAALQGMQADAIVLCELENNTTAWSDLLAGLNAAVGAGTYSGLVHETTGGFTQSAIFYKTSVLTPVTPLYWLFTSTFQRAHLTQGFEVNSTGGRFLLSSAHLRSKLCDNATGSNLDQSDGQSCYNALRRTQTQELVTHWASLRTSSGISSHLMVGDFNSYRQEDPMDVLRAAGLQDLGQADDHSFRYQGNFGTLDHAFATSSMEAAVTGMEHWAINSDEPPVMDYTDANTAFYQANAFRSSDHDPIVVGIDAPMLSTGLAEAEASQMVRFRGHPLDRVQWTSDVPFRVEVFDMLGRPVNATTAFHLTATLNLGASPTGLYHWRCSGIRGEQLATGTFLVH